MGIQYRYEGPSAVRPAASKRWRPRLDGRSWTHHLGHEHTAARVRARVQHPAVPRTDAVLPERTDVQRPPVRGAAAAERVEDLVCERNVLFYNAR